MFTWRLRPPTSSTWPTPVVPSRRLRTKRSATSVTSRTGLGAASVMVTTGVASGSMRVTVGSSMSLGSEVTTPLMRSRTSWAATSGSFSRTKVTNTCETPSDDEERSSSMPLMVLTASSILSVIWVSTSVGAAPGNRVVIVTTGKSTLGNRSTPRRP